MDKLEVIIKSYCEIMILLEYEDEKARDNVLYENLKIENGQEEIIKRKYVQEKLNGKKRDGSHIWGIILDYLSALIWIIIVMRK